jgi:protein gp37
MRKANWHSFQVLTKRPERVRELDRKLIWSENIWMGTSVESAAYVTRVAELIHTRAHIKFLSVEPLLGPIPDLPLASIDWVIVGGESGRKPRPMEEEWVIEIRDQCERARVPFFFKQWGGRNKKENGRILDGKTWDEMPLPLPKVVDLSAF